MKSTLHRCYVSIIPNLNHEVKYMNLDIIIVILPVALLFVYSILNVIKRKTKTKLDDEAAEVVGEILEGLGKDIPKPIDPDTLD